MALRDTPESCAVGDGILAAKTSFDEKLRFVQFRPDGPGFDPSADYSKPTAVIEPEPWIFRRSLWQNPPRQPEPAWIREI
jgi:hypothetical protein